MMKYVLLFILGILLLVSCKSEAEKNIIKWQGKNIEFDKKLVTTIYGLDTVNYENFFTAKNKIFIYVDSMGCTSCKLRLKELKAFNEYILRELRIDVPILVLFDNKSVNKIAAVARRDRYDLPICIDNNSTMSSKYDFSDNMT